MFDPVKIVTDLIDFSQRQADRAEEHIYQDWLSNREAILRERDREYERIRSTEGDPAADRFERFLLAEEYEVSWIDRAEREQRLQWKDPPDRTLYGLWREVRKIDLGVF